MASRSRQRWMRLVAYWNAWAENVAISGPRPLTKLQPDGGIAGPLHRLVLKSKGVVRCRVRDAMALWGR
jgi:hypothetical protein